MTTREDRWSVALAAGGVWLLLDVLRMWTPSLITVFGRAAETPPELIGAFALACGAAPLLLLLALPRSERSARSALVLLLVARLALTFTDGNRPQLVVASLGVVAGFWWLALWCGRNARLLVPGLAWGLMAATTAHAALGTYGAVWRRDAAGWVETALVTALTVAALLRTPGRATTQPPGRRAAWLVLPALLLCGVVLTNPGRASSVAGVPGVLACVAGCLLAVLVSGTRPRRAAGVLAGLALVAATAVGAVVPVTYDGLAGAQPWVQAWVFLLGTPAVLVLLAAAVSPDGRGGPFAVAGGVVVWVVLLFVYYAGYDLGYRADVALVAVAVVVAVLALTGRRDPARLGAAPRAPAAVLAPVAVVALLLAAIGPWATLRPIPDDRKPVTDDQLRVVAYNLRMGYGIDGRFDQYAVATLLADQYADVILLSEIDRGWLLNGGQDQLRILARLLGMEAAFGPAADPVWGDAILTRSPMRDVRSHAFPSYGAVTGAQALQATFTWRDRPVTVISTHLQPGSGGTDDTAGQARDLASLMSAARAEGVVVAGGDLNTTVGSGPWRDLLATGFTDALAAARPLLTASADDPDEEIDHVLVSPGVKAVDPRTLTTELSDHLPVVVDLVLPEAG